VTDSEVVSMSNVGSSYEDVNMSRLMANLGLLQADLDTLNSIAE